jgi:Holliday junction resolvase-like predicted endonuclease
MNEQMILDKHKGAAAEVAACLWLLNQGYEVFRNISIHGIVDLVATRGDEVVLIDVKTEQFIRPSATEEQAARGREVPIC